MGIYQTEVKGLSGDLSDLELNLETGDVRVPRMRRAICRISWGPAQTRPSTVFRRSARDLHWVLSVLF